MIFYLLKTIGCTGIFLLVYQLLLEREKMHRFNRWFLLCSVLFSFLIPLVSIPVSRQVLPVVNEDLVILWENTPVNVQHTTAPITPAETGFPLATALLIAYAVVTVSLLFRFIRNLYRLNRAISTGEIMWRDGIRLIVSEEQMSSYTFLNTIFISREDLEGGSRPEVLVHELAHARQKHSVDILFIECVRIFCWFNPFLILYKRAIQLNHEFLADDAVLDRGADIRSYQHLLLDKIGLHQPLPITSSFNYSITKKRLLMMTHSTSRGKAALTQFGIFPLAAAVLFVFSSRSIAQQQKTTPPEIVKYQADTSVSPKKIHPLLLKAPSTKEGVSKELFEEYQMLEARNITTDSKGRIAPNWRSISEADRDRMEAIFLKMNKEQQLQVHIFFMKPLPPFEKAAPSQAQLDSWKKTSMYGLWIDEKRVPNSVLNQYKPEDFAHYFESRLSKNAVNYGNHYVQVDLMTVAYYKEYREKTLANKTYKMGFIVKPERQSLR